MTKQQKVVKWDETKIKLTQQLAIAEEALNIICIAQMGSLDYTQDFFELTKNTVREALAKIEELRNE